MQQEQRREFRHLWLLGIAIHVLTFLFVLDLYFTSPIKHGMAAHRMQDAAPLAQRLVVFIADGLRSEAIYTDAHHARVPYLSDLRLARACSWGVVHTGVPTESRPGHVAIFAGLYEDPSAIMTGWQANTVEFDSVINQSHYAWSYGSPDIVKIFTKQDRAKLHVEYYDPEREDFSGRTSTIQLDAWVFERVGALLTPKGDSCEARLVQKRLASRKLRVKREELVARREECASQLKACVGDDYECYREFKLCGDAVSSVEAAIAIEEVDLGMDALNLLGCKKHEQENHEPLRQQGNIFFLHLLGMDSAGHVHKPDSKEYLENLKALDNGIRNMELLFDEYFGDNQTAFLFTSDHGMTNWGSHGDGSDHETEVPYIVWGRGVKPNPFRVDLRQADLAPLMASLIGIPIPVNSVGILPHGILNGTYKQIAEVVFANVMQHIELYQLLLKEFDNDPLFDEYAAFRNDYIAETVERMRHALSAQGELQQGVVKMGEALMKDILAANQYMRNFYFKPKMATVMVGFVLWILYLALSILPAVDQVDDQVVVWQYNFRIAAMMMTLVAVIYLKLLEVKYFTYLYPMFPMGVLTILSDDRAVVNQLLIICRMRNRTNFLLRTCVYAGLVQMLVLGFFNRLFCAGVIVILAVWLTQNRLRIVQKTKWLAATCLLAVLQIIEPNTKFNYYGLLLGSVIWICIYAIFILPEGRAYVTFFDLKYKVLTRNILVSPLILYGIGALNAWYVAYAFDSEVGLSDMNMVISWAISCMVLLLIPTAPRGILTRFSHIAACLIVPYALMAVNIDLIFYTILVLSLHYWIRTEAEMHAPGGSLMLTHFSVSFTPHPLPDLAALYRRTYFYLALTVCYFFAIGNMASFNGFDPQWTRAYVATFNPFLMATLILVKMIVPFFLITCAFYAIVLYTRSNYTNVFMILLLFLDQMVLNFMLFVRNEGSWKDIGKSLSHFAVMEAMALVMLVFFGIARYVCTFRIGDAGTGYEPRMAADHKVSVEEGDRNRLGITTRVDVKAAYTSDGINRRWWTYLCRFRVDNPNPNLECNFEESTDAQSDTSDLFTYYLNQSMATQVDHRGSDYNELFDYYLHHEYIKNRKYRNKDGDEVESSSSSMYSARSTELEQEIPVKERKVYDCLTLTQFVELINIQNTEPPLFEKSPVAFKTRTRQKLKHKKSKKHVKRKHEIFTNTDTKKPEVPKLNMEIKKVLRKIENVVVDIEEERRETPKPHYFEHQTMQLADIADYKADMSASNVQTHIFVNTTPTQCRLSNHDISVNTAAENVPKVDKQMKKDVEVDTRMNQSHLRQETIEILNIINQMLDVDVHQVQTDVVASLEVSTNTEQGANKNGKQIQGNVSNGIEEDGTLKQPHLKQETIEILNINDEQKFSSEAQTETLIGITKHTQCNDRNHHRKREIGQQTEKHLNLKSETTEILNITNQQLSVQKSCNETQTNRRIGMKKHTQCDLREHHRKGVVSEQTENHPNLKSETIQILNITDQQLSVQKSSNETQTNRIIGMKKHTQCDLREHHLKREVNEQTEKHPNLKSETIQILNITDQQLLVQKSSNQAQTDSIRGVTQHTQCYYRMHLRKCEVGQQTQNHPSLKLETIQILSIADQNHEETHNQPQTEIHLCPKKPSRKHHPVVLKLYRNGLYVQKKSNVNLKRKRSQEPQSESRKLKKPCKATSNSTKRKLVIHQQDIALQTLRLENDIILVQSKHEQPVLIDTGTQPMNTQNVISLPCNANVADYVSCHASDAQHTCTVAMNEIPRECLSFRRAMKLNLCDGRVRRYQSDTAMAAGRTWSAHGGRCVRQYCSATDLHAHHALRALLMRYRRRQVAAALEAARQYDVEVNPDECMAIAHRSHHHRVRVRKQKGASDLNNMRINSSRCCCCSCCCCCACCCCPPQWRIDEKPLRFTRVRSKLQLAPEIEFEEVQLLFLTEVERIELVNRLQLTPGLKTSAQLKLIHEYRRKMRRNDKGVRKVVKVQDLGNDTSQSTDVRQGKRVCAEGTQMGDADCNKRGETEIIYHYIQDMGDGKEVTITEVTSETDHKVIHLYRSKKRSGDASLSSSIRSIIAKKKHRRKKMKKQSDRKTDNVGRETVTCQPSHLCIGEPFPEWSLINRKTVSEPINLHVPHIVKTYSRFDMNAWVKDSDLMTSTSSPNPPQQVRRFKELIKSDYLKRNALMGVKLEKENDASQQTESQLSEKIEWFFDRVSGKRIARWEKKKREKIEEQRAKEEEIRRREEKAADKRRREERARMEIEFKKIYPNVEFRYASSTAEPAEPQPTRSRLQRAKEEEKRKREENEKKRQREKREQMEMEFKKIYPNVKFQYESSTAVTAEPAEPQPTRSRLFMRSSPTLIKINSNSTLVTEAHAAEDRVSQCGQTRAKEMLVKEKKVKQSNMSSVIQSIASVGHKDTPQGRISTPSPPDSMVRRIPSPDLHEQDEKDNLARGDYSAIATIALMSSSTSESSEVSTPRLALGDDSSVSQYLDKVESWLSVHDSCRASSPPLPPSPTPSQPPKHRLFSTVAKNNCHHANTECLASANRPDMGAKFLYKIASELVTENPLDPSQLADIAYIATIIQSVFQLALREIPYTPYALRRPPSRTTVLRSRGTQTVKTTRAAAAAAAVATKTTSCGGLCHSTSVGVAVYPPDVLRRHYGVQHYPTGETTIYNSTLTIMPATASAVVTVQQVQQPLATRIPRRDPCSSNQRMKAPPPPPAPAAPAPAPPSLPLSLEEYNETVDMLRRSREFLRMKTPAPTPAAPAPAPPALATPAPASPSPPIPLEECIEADPTRSRSKESLRMKTSAPSPPPAPADPAPAAPVLATPAPASPSPPLPPEECIEAEPTRSRSRESLRVKTAAPPPAPAALAPAAPSPPLPLEECIEAEPSRSRLRESLRMKTPAQSPALADPAPAPPALATPAPGPPSPPLPFEERIETVQTPRRSRESLRPLSPEWNNGGGGSGITFHRRTLSLPRSMHPGPAPHLPDYLCNPTELVRRRQLRTSHDGNTIKTGDGITRGPRVLQQPRPELINLEAITQAQAANRENREFLEQRWRRAVCNNRPVMNEVGTPADPRFRQQRSDDGQVSPEGRSSVLDLRTVYREASLIARTDSMFVEGDAGAHGTR